MSLAAASVVWFVLWFVLKVCFVCVFCAWCVLGAAAWQVIPGMSSGHRIRRTRSFDSDIIGVIEPGEVFLVLGQQDGWVEVQRQGKRGWAVISTGGKTYLRLVNQLGSVRLLRNPFHVP